MCIVTWNVGNTQPDSRQLAALLSDEVCQSCSLIAVGVQECFYRCDGSNVRDAYDEDDEIDPQQQQAVGGEDESSLSSSSSSSSSSDEACSWKQMLVSHMDPTHSVVATAVLQQIQLVVFVRRRDAHWIGNEKTMTEATGFANMMGNKGATVVAFHFKDTSFCFVNTHLAAHQDQTARRNADANRIAANIVFDGREAVSSYDHVFWCGDLNYRLDLGGTERTPSAAVFDAIVGLVERREFETLFATDQLSRERALGHVFHGFDEATQHLLQFAPTFKVVPRLPLHKSLSAASLLTLPPPRRYNPQRSPAWCDRILFKSVRPNDIGVTAYSSVPEVTTSDHTPVRGVFRATVHAHRQRDGCVDGVDASMLSIFALRGWNLAICDAASHSSDPYVVFSGDVLCSQVRTSVINKSLSPRWYERLEVPLRTGEEEDLLQSKVLVTVFDRDMLKHDDVIGYAQIPLSLLFDRGRSGSTFFTVSLTRGGVCTGKLSGRLEMWWPRKLRRSRPKSF